MFSNKSFNDSQIMVVSTETDSAMNFTDSVENNSAASYGSETEEDIDIKPGISDFFVKIEPNFYESLVFKTELLETNVYKDFSKRPKPALQKIEFPLLVPKPEPVSDTELSPVNNFSQTEIDMIDESILEDKTNLTIEKSEIVIAEEGSLSNSESCALEEYLMRKRKRAKKKKHLTVSQMCKIIQNDNGFFMNKKKWMTEKVLRRLPAKEKIFLSNLLKKFMKRNKSKK